MNHSTGIYNNHGYVQIRIWPWAKAVNPSPYREKGFGCWCKQHIALAETRLAELRKLIKDGLFDKDKPKPLQFGDAWALFYRKHYVERTRSRKSRTNIASQGRQFLAFTDFAKPIHEMIPNDFRAYVTHRVKLGVGPCDIDRHLATLESMFNCFENWLKCRDIDPVLLPPFNPVEPVERPSLAGTERERVASRDERAALKRWCAANDPDLGVLICQALTSFLRDSDHQAAQGQDNVKGLAGKTGKKFHIPVDFSRKIKVRNRHRRWSAAKKACGIADLHWHDLRHTGATIARALGASLDELQEALQHSTPEQTMDYVNARAERLGPIVQSVQSDWDSL